MKNLSRLLIIALTSQILSFNYSNAQTGKWTRVKTLAPHANMGACLLMPDGTVICHNTSGGGMGFGWDRLTPDIHGSYINGTWDTIAPMANDRLFFSTQVLPSGKVYAAGGEYGSGGPNGEVYDPVSNSWSACGPIPVGWSISDGNSILLANGNVLEGPQLGAQWSFDCLLWSPVTNLYTVAPSSIYNHDEAAWLKLPDSSVLFVGIASDSSNRYIPKTNTWIRDSVVPGNMYDGLEETGAASMLPNGKAVFFGATGYNAIYTPSGNTSPGTWATADSLPVINGCTVAQSDAPCAMMVNGHILLSVAPTNACAGQFAPPCYFMEYDYLTNTFTQVKDTLQGIGTDSIPEPSYKTQMLVLPDGNVLLSISQSNLSTSYYVYTPGSGPIPQGKPTIDNVVHLSCSNYMVTGKLFNGISEGASYGDDWEMSTNYPLVRFTNGSNVYYATTSNWNRIAAVQTDSLADTAYFSTAAIPGGTYTMVVVVNGFESNPRTITMFGVSISSQTNITCSNQGSATALAAGGTPSYTYLWSPGGSTDASISNLSAGTYTVTAKDNSGCSVTAAAKITQPAILNVFVDSSSNIPCNGASNGSASVFAVGGTPAYTYLWSGGAGTNAKENGLSAGTYTITASDSCGFIATTSVTINQPSAITITTSSLSANSNCNGVASVSVNGGNPPYNYLWSPGGETTDTIKSQCAGTYCCTVTDNSSCSQTVCIDITPAGIEDIESGTSHLNVYPVPSKGNFTIVFSRAQLIPGSKTIEIYNVFGEKVYTQLLQQAKPEYLINLDAQPSGIYFIRVLNEDDSLSGKAKIVIEK